MNYKPIFISLALIALCLIALRVTVRQWPRPLSSDNTGNLDRQRFPASEEVHQHWQLAPGAQVKLKDIAGPVTIETRDTDVAEIYAERAATEPVVLSAMQLTASLEPAQSSAAQMLFLHNPVWRAQRAQMSRLWREVALRQTPADFRERVVLRLPRRVNLLVSEIYGDLMIGEVDGIVRVVSVEGRVTIAKATEARQLERINGPLEATLTRLGAGLEVALIRGPVKLHFLEAPDARLSGTLIFGGVNARWPGLRVTSNNFFSFHGESGTSAAPLHFYNIRGAVTLDSLSEP